MEEFRCKWGKSIRVITGLVTLVFVVSFVSIVIAGVEEIISALFIAIFTLTFGITYLFCPKYITISQGNLVVKKMYGEVLIKLSDIKSVERRTESMFGDIRVVGSGGFFGYIGKFRRFGIGNYTAYMTDPKKMFWVVTEKKRYLLSCENCDILIELIKAKK